MPFLETLAGVNAGVGLFNTLFGDDPQTSQTMKAIRALLKRGKYGFGDEVLGKLKTSRRNLAANEIAGYRASAASRLQKQGVPVQVQEQILADISGEGMQRLSGVLNEIDFANEQEKLRALQSAGSLAQGLPGAPQGQGLGDSLAFLLLSGQNKNFGSYGDIIGGNDFMSPAVDYNPSNYDNTRWG